jgi:type IV secretory pathway TraG/TraD family ATPase VirD4
MLSKSSHQIINGVSITLEASFGCLQNPIRNNCMFVNDDTLMFISGKHIVLYDIIRKR